MTAVWGSSLNRRFRNGQPGALVLALVVALLTAQLAALDHTHLDGSSVDCGFCITGTDAPVALQQPALPVVSPQTPVAAFSREVVPTRRLIAFRSRAPPTTT